MNRRALRAVFRAELTLFVREPVGLFFTVVFPVLLLLIIGWSFGSVDAGNGYKVADLYVPAMYAMVIANLALMSLPMVLAEYRENGIFKRYRATPVGLSVHVLAHLLVHGLVALVSCALVTVVGVTVFGVKAAPGVWQIAPVLLLGTVAFYAGGFLLGGVFSSARSTQAVGGALFFVMMFASGAAIPRVWFPGWLQTATGVLPMTQLVTPLTDLWSGGSLTGSLVPIIVLAAIAAAAVAASIRWFRWQ